MTKPTRPATRPEHSQRDAATIDQLVFRFAGGVILLALTLAYALSPYWLWLAAFVGANLLQASYTGFCPLAMLLRRLGVPPGAAFNASC